MPQEKHDLLQSKVPRTETTPVVEKASEVPKERPAPAPELSKIQEAEVSGGPTPVQLPATPAPVAPPKDPLTAQVEEILEEDLKEVYAGLPEALKPKFRKKGEEVAEAIVAMLTTAKVKARKVLKLIIAWLKIIPGVNKFFLEQEAAIKAQKILAVAKERKKE